MKISKILIHNFRNVETVCQKCRERVSVTPEQRRHISCMIWMRAIFRIIMAFTVRKIVILIPGTAITTVNMKSQYRIYSKLE